MTEQSYRIRTGTMFDRERLRLVADFLAVALVAALPWSTSFTGIFAGLWLIVLIPTLEWAALRRVLSTPAGGLPVLLWALAVVGMLWAFDVLMKERLGGLSSYFKLLAIPLLIVQFQRSEHAAWVMNAFLVSCGVMLLLSWVLFLAPELPWSYGQHGGRIGVPFRDYIMQSAEFTVCILLLVAMVRDLWQQRRRGFAIVLSLLALIFLANIAFVSTSRTSLVVMPILLLLFTCKQLPWKATIGALILVAVLGVITWTVAIEVRSNVTGVLNEVRNFQPEGEGTRAGERLEFWRKSIGFVADSPLIGHGTGSIRDQFRRSVTGQMGMAAMAAENPHNQTLAVALQLGLVGTAVLFAMWLAHVLLFRGEGFAAWAGLVIASQNIIGSLFNSHLFDFAEGWGYVIGVGVAGGVILKNAAEAGSVQRPVLRNVR